MRVEFVSECECPGDLEQIVAGNADAQGAGSRLEERILEHRLVAGVDGGLGRVRRGLPVVECGFHFFHCEVGALDQTHLDAGAGALVTGVGPVDEGGEGAMGIGDVGLQHDSRGEIVELFTVENRHERAQTQLEVAILLHVEVDESPR